jgi:hypothetical protein
VYVLPFLQTNGGAGGASTITSNSSNSSSSPLAQFTSLALASLPPHSVFIAVGGVQVQLLACVVCNPGGVSCVDGAHVVGVVTRSSRAVEAAEASGGFFFDCTPPCSSSGSVASPPHVVHSSGSVGGSPSPVGVSTPGPALVGRTPSVGSAVGGRVAPVVTESVLFASSVVDLRLPAVRGSQASV